MSNKNSHPSIYLDYAASTPVDPTVLEAMLPYFSEEYGNPSSIHTFGQRALAAIDEAREKVAKFLGCEQGEIIFTSSATEANNLAIQGVVAGAIKTQNSNLKTQNHNSKLKTKKPHIITTQIEHDSVLETCRALEKEGVEVTYLPITKDGFVRVSDVEKAIKENTVLVSVMYANNEIGTVQPIAEIGRVIEQKNKLRTKNQKPKTYLHTDAVQAANYLDCNVEKLGVDLLTLSGHKIYGPKGVGALYVRKGTSLAPLVYGGGQEFGLRSGTENVAAIAGFGAAISQISNLKTQNHNAKLKTLRDKLIDGVSQKISGVRLNGSREHRLPSNANFCFPDIDAETLIVALDQKGIAVSSGAACSTRAIQPSHVLLALGLSEKEASSSIRITIGRYTTEKEINTFLRVLPKIIERVKMVSR